MKILLTWQAVDAEIEAVASSVPSGATVVAQPVSPCFSRFDCSLESIEAHLADADVIIGWVLPDGALESATKLRLLVWMHAGCDELNFPALKARGVEVANIRGANAIAVTEHAIALLLGLAKRLPQAHEAVRVVRAAPYYVPGLQSSVLQGKTVGIVGLGRIGTAIARRLKAFDVRIIGTRRNAARGGDHFDLVYGPDGLHDMLETSDYVILAVPLTKETDGMFGRAEFAAMRPCSFLINVARGNLVQELALVEALDSGNLAGYGTDVWWFYANAYPASYHFPAPSRMGVHLRADVLGTGGQASNAEGIVERSIAQAIESIQDYAAGQPLRWAVDLDLGY